MCISMYIISQVQYVHTDVVKNLEKSARMQNVNHSDLLVIDESHDQSYCKVMEAWMALFIMEQ